MRLRSTEWKRYVSYFGMFYRLVVFKSVCPARNYFKGCENLRGNFKIYETFQENSMRCEHFVRRFPLPVSNNWKVKKFLKFFKGISITHQFPIDYKSAVIQWRRKTGLMSSHGFLNLSWIVHCPVYQNQSHLWFHGCKVNKTRRDARTCFKGC